MKVVSNSSPLIVLTKINRIDLLKHLFTSVYISEEVYREVYKIKKEHCPKWIKIAKVKDRMAVDALDAVVDKGEAGRFCSVLQERKVTGTLSGNRFKNLFNYAFILMRRQY